MPYRKQKPREFSWLFLLYFMAKIIKRRMLIPQPDKITRILNIKEFYEKRNKILIIRGVGGLGDIFMHRMIFEDVKTIMPDAEIHFACPKQYHDALIDHPYIDKILDSETIDKTKYLVSYNTTTVCGRYEMTIAPFSDLHRSDIWSTHCGLNLANHEMHIKITEEEKEWAKAKLKEIRDREGPIVIVCPISAMQNKNLLDHQLFNIIDDLYLKGCCVIGLHTHPIEPLFKKNIPCLYKLSIRQWMSILNEADYVVSVDTSAFHCAGGLKKPLLGIFTFADGKIYGKYFDFVLVQKHRLDDPMWTCGPCYNWCNCPKTKNNPKPCLTEINQDMLSQGINKMFDKWPDERVKNKTLVTNIG